MRSITERTKAQKTDVGAIGVGFFNSTVELVTALIDEKAGLPCICETRSLFDAILSAYDVSPRISDARYDVPLHCDPEVSDQVWNYLNNENTRWSDLLVGDPFFWDDECTITTEVKDMVRGLRGTVFQASDHLCGDVVISQVDNALGFLTKDGVTFIKRTLHDRIEARFKERCDCTG